MKQYVKPQILLVDCESQILASSIAIVETPVEGDAERISRGRSEWDNIWDR